MPLRKLVPLVAAALALAACSSDPITGPTQTRTVPHFEDGTGMLGGGGDLIPTDGTGMLGGGGHP